MAKQKLATKKSKQAANGQNGGIVTLTNDAGAIVTDKEVIEHLKKLAAEKA